MGGSDYTVSDSRIGQDAVSNIIWRGNCGLDVLDWVKTNKAIIAASITSSAHAPASESFQLRWRNLTDAGSFATLTTSGELRRGISAGCITNTDTVGDPSLCPFDIPDDSEEVENESPLQTASMSCAKENYIFTQWCVDFSFALDTKEYEFEIYSQTESASCGVCPSTITTETIPTLPQTDSRIADAVESWQGVCDVDITGWDKADDFILSTYATGGAGLKSFKLQWKVAGGSFADVGAATTIGWNANTTLVDENTVGTPAGCLTSTVSEESEGDNDILLILMGASVVAEFQWALAFNSAADDTIYEFQLVCITDSTQEVCSCSIRTQVVVAATINKINGVLDSGINKINGVTYSGVEKVSGVLTS